MIRTFITGTGMCSSLGNNPTTAFENLLSGKTGVRSFPEWKELKGLFSYVGAPAQPVDISKIPRSSRRTMSRMSEFAVAATLDALGQADLQLSEDRSAPRVAICMGSTAASAEVLQTYFSKYIERGGPEGQLGTTFFKVMNHTVAANVASALGFRGPALSCSSACTSSAQAMILGWELIQSGQYDIVITGGADELHPISCAVFDVVQASSRRYNDQPELTPRPFDSDRDGLVVSEGAGVVILESEASMKARRVRPLAEFNSGAYFCEGTHMSQSSQSAMIETIKLALDRAQLPASSVGYINAHATATIHGDIEEAQAMARAFGESVPVSSLKGHFGHSLAACGAIEAILSIMMMERGVLIPTRNLQNVDPHCRGANLIQEVSYKKVRTLLSNNFAFGGMNTCLLLSSCE